MGGRGIVGSEENKGVIFSNSGVKIQWSKPEGSFHPGGFFASVGQVGVGFGISPNPPALRETSTRSLHTNSFMKLISAPELGFQISGVPEFDSSEPSEFGEEDVVAVKKKKMMKNGGRKVKIKIANPSLRRLISGAIAGCISRTMVSPLETIRTHLMVGSCGQSTGEVFRSIMETDGWRGLFRGNLVNVIRVTPSKAIELFAYDTVKKHLTPKLGEEPKIPISPSLLAGAVAGVSSTLCTYPLELLKTQLTVQRGVYDNLLDALVKIVREKGPGELYRGLSASLIGVIPYAATNYFAYDTLRKAYMRAFKKEEVGHWTTLAIGSFAATFSSSATFPLEVGRKHMQASALSGIYYDHIFHAIERILEKEGVGGLYRGLGPSCLKLIPAAGISFMCYEACKKILVDEAATTTEDE